MKHKEHKAMRAGPKTEFRTVGKAGGHLSSWAETVLLLNVVIPAAVPAWAGEAHVPDVVEEESGPTEITPLVALLTQAEDAAAWRAFNRLVRALPEVHRAQVLHQFCSRNGADAVPSDVFQSLCQELSTGPNSQSASTVSLAGGVTEERRGPAAREIAGAIDLGASLSSGDTQERAFSARIEARQRLGGRWRQELAIDGDWARRSGATSQQRLTGDHRLFYAFSERATVFQFLRGEYDRFAGFDYRITESIGVGYDVIAHPRLTWHLEGGPGIRFIALADSPAMEQEPIARLSSELTWRLRPDWTLENRSSAFLGGEGNTLENKISLEARINSALFGRVSLHLRYDTKELAGISKLDTLTKFSIGYRF